jgi:hypothetical protein
MLSKKAENVAATTFKARQTAGRGWAVSDAARQQQPIVSGSQVVAAGVASAAAAVVTSRFGVAGTLLGAAVTSMIITGGSAILKAYLESVTGSVRKMPRKVRAQRNRRQAGRGAVEPDTIPERPDLRQNFVGRLRAAFGWFSHLPRFNRRSIMVKGLISALVAFVIGIGAITAVEAGVLGNSLSCSLWSNCNAGQTPGIGGGTADTSTGGTTLSRAFSGAQNSQPTLDPETGQPVDPGIGQPVDPGTGEPVDPAVPAEPAPETPAPEEPVTPTPAPEEPVPGEEVAPSGAEQAAPLE